MHKYEIKPPLLKKLRKLKAKDVQSYGRIRAKIGEIIQDPLRYKPLKHGLKGLRRVHIRHFVLSFYVYGDTVYFLDYEHHDKAYR